ncbi:reverse transcriptase domain-containing protein [Tanacetum coccineum]
MNDLESDDESVDTPLVSPFSHLDNDSDDGEVLNELIEYENVRMLRREKAINSFDGDDLAFQFVRDVYVFVGSFTYITDFVDYMATHTERMERFENIIFKQREEINGRMTEMFRLIKELTTNRTPEKVLIREEAKSPITKGVNSISLIREEEEKNDIYDVETGDDSKGTNKPDMEVAIKEVETMNGAKNGAENMPIKKVKKEEVVEAHGSRPVKYYLKYRINEELIRGLVDNNRGLVYEAILKKKITKKEDIGGNFELPCGIGGLKHVNVLVDQGSDVNIMPYSTYVKLTDKRPAETDIRLSLASHSYIYPLGIAKDVLVEVAKHVYPVYFMILDIKEDERKTKGGLSSQEHHS